MTGMADMMNFPKRWEDFLHDYEFEDARRIYTNGSRLIPSFRVKQMMEHYAPVRHGRWVEQGEYAVCMECKNDKSGKTTETAEPQPDGIQFRTVDDLGRICIPKDIRDKLGIKSGTECAVYATDELTNEEIIVIRRNKNEKTNCVGT